MCTESKQMHSKFLLPLCPETFVPINIRRKRESHLPVNVTDEVHMENISASLE